MSKKILSDLLDRIAREREADARGSRRRRRPVAALLRYAVLGAVALSILPASAAAALPAGVPQGKLGTRADSEPQRASARPQQEKTAAPPARRARLPWRVNMRPLRELLLRGKTLYDTGSLDLSRTVELTLEADCEDDGSLVNVSMLGASLSDPTVAELAKEAVDALNQSRLLGFLEGARHLSVKFRLDGQTLVVETGAEFVSEESARRSGARLGADGHMFFEGPVRPSEVIWVNSRFTADGKQLAMKLEMSRQQAGQLLLQIITPN